MAARMNPFLTALGEGRDLAAAEATEAFDIIMEGGATQAQIGAFLMGHKVKGETAIEIAAAAKALLARCPRVACPPGAIDIVGTGGDKTGAVNISTAAALIVAGLGIPVAKHDNRSITSKAGTADTLEVLGVKVDLGPRGAEHCLKTAGICFMMAPIYHQAMRHVAPARIDLGVPTLFNLMGPLANPAPAKSRVTRAGSCLMLRFCPSLASRRPGLPMATVWTRSPLQAPAGSSRSAPAQSPISK